MSLSSADLRNSPRLYSSNPPPAELNLATSTPESGKPVVAVKTTAEADTELATMLADSHQDDWSFQRLPPESSFAQWRGRFDKALSSPAMQAWISAQNFQAPRLHIVGTTLTVKEYSGKITTFTPSDGSGWWPIGRQVIASAAMLDPHGKDLSMPGSRVIPAEIAAFYGVRWPINKADEEALKANGFPEDDPLRSPEMRALAEREFMDVENESALIKTLLNELKDKPDDEDIDLRAISQKIAPGSSLGIANRSGLRILKRLMRDPLMAPILSEKGIDVNAKFRLENGLFMVCANGASGPWHEVTESVLAHPTLAQLLNTAIEQSQTTGQIIRQQSVGDMWQLLRFATWKELPAINTAGELRNILNWKLNPLPPEPAMGGYARNFLEDKQSPDSLSEEQRIRVRRSAPGASIPPQLTLLDCSPKPWAGQSQEYIRDNADELISQALTQGAGQRRCEPILAVLQDDSSLIKSVSPEYRQQLITSRDLLCIDPELGSKRNYIAGYNLYSVSNTGKTLSNVRAELTQHLATTTKLPTIEAELITHMMLATSAPEFLAKGAGDIRVGTSAHVNLRIQTALVEMVSPGSSRDMSVDQICQRSFMTVSSSDHDEVVAVASAGPIYDWAVGIGVVEADDNYSDTGVQRALSAYSQRMEEYSGAVAEYEKEKSNFNTRSELGNKELEAKCPGETDFLYKKIMSSGSSKYTAGLLGLLLKTDTETLLTGGYSISELYLSGVLTAQNVDKTDWELLDSKDKARFKALVQNIKQLTPIESVFDIPFSRATTALEALNVTAMKTQLSELPVEDRRRLEFGEVFICGASSEQDDDITAEEAQKKIGQIIFAKDEFGAKCYEFFPLENRYVERHELLARFQRMAENNNEAIRFLITLPKKDAPSLPVDISIKGYFAKRERPSDVDEFVPDTYSSIRTNAIIKVLQDEKLLINREDLLKNAKGLTANERFKMIADGVETFVINTLVPFKGSIEDIASGDRKRLVMGLIGLGLELVGALFVVGGAIRSLGKGATLLTKAMHFAKMTMSMFNLPGAVYGTGKSVFKLSAMGVKTLAGLPSKALGKGIVTLKNLAHGGCRNTQNIIKLGSNNGASKEVVNLMKNTGLVNTAIGIDAYDREPLPQESSGSVPELVV
ncbi:hypothetical protein [Pseudomonas paralactis]|nr:hypothetical protein [Pseudomonas paralactis]